MCRKVTEETNGTYSIVLDAKHYKDILMAQIAPPPVMANATSKVGLGLELGLGLGSGLGLGLEHRIGCQAL